MCQLHHNVIRWWTQQILVGTFCSLNSEL